MAKHPIHILLNDFAIRSFRDIADRDYVHARLAYRAQLVPQFLWSSLHCLEKYTKCILLLNRIDAKGIRHAVSPLLERLNTKAKFQIHLSKEPQRFLSHIEGMAEYRYFEVSYHNLRYDLPKLDRAVWELRRYCQPLDYTIKHNGKPIDMFKMNIDRIRKGLETFSKDTCIQNGWLEDVISKKKHASREPLLWNNLFFGSSNRKKVKMSGFMEAGNSPLFMHPEVLDHVLQYVFIPGNVVKAWREELASRQNPANV
jgi:hypothetical protein